MLRPDLDEDCARGIRSGRAWAEHASNLEALAEVEAFDWYQDPSYEQVLILFMRCIDPPGET